jgi:hypothetical protein
MLSLSKRIVALIFQNDFNKPAFAEASLCKTLRVAWRLRTGRLSLTYTLAIWRSTLLN